MQHARPRLRQRLQSVLALLDQGFSIYRRNFFSLLLVGAIPLVPLAAVLVAVFYNLGLDVFLIETPNEIIRFYALLGAALLIGFPFTIYLLAAMARAAQAAVENRPVTLGEALRIGPLKLFQTGIFMIIMTAISQAIGFAVGMVFLCPLYAMIFAVGGLIGTTSPGEQTAIPAIILVAGIAIILYILFYIVLLLVSGATYAAMVYGIYPFATEKLRFGAAISHSFALLGHRFKRNLAVWSLAGALTSLVGLVASGTCGALVSAPLYFLFGAQAEFAVIAGIIAYTLGGVISLPLLPIWMALLYKQNVESRNGVDLATRAAAWSQTTGPAPLAG